MKVIERKTIWYLIALALILPGIIVMAISGLNLGIDFTGGNIIQVSFTETVTTEQIRDVVSRHVTQSPSVQASDNNSFLIRTEAMSEDESNAVLAELESALGAMEVESNEAIGPVIGQELSRNAVIALVLAMILMLIYIAIRFKFQFAIGAVLALATDVLVTLSFVAMLRIEVNSSFIAAILTIVGYSINNTIVIFDRIRENMKGMKKTDLKEQINTSVKQTLTRSINTVIAVLLLLLALFIFGGDTTKDFILILIIGTVEGLYSSVFLAGSYLFDVSKIGGKKKNTQKAKASKKPQPAN